ncbi:hypothetical protein SteCoe_35208 [Stentor coeruleus]|uniref:Arf-GAP domain-containing protein n=1 Tax=Stentor coeruleus TaxID=5963 RepID=A0A1R2ASZ7_9CILI|nr:hypothetical protein SteCoe_35208 [Stentor coeruleus]
MMIFQNLSPQQQLLDLRNQDENSSCMDCSSANPDFASPTYGIFICYSCYKRHLILGPSISQVKNLQCNWSLEDIKAMQTGGNSAFLTFLNYYKISSAPIEYKYRTSAAAYYKDMLNYISKGQEYNRELLTISKGQEEIFQANLTPYEVVEIIDFISKDEKENKLGFEGNSEEEKMDMENKRENPEEEFKDIEIKREVFEDELRNIDIKENNFEPEKKPLPPAPYFLKRLENNMLKVFSKVSSTNLGTFVENIGQKLIQFSGQVPLDVKELDKLSANQKKPR